MNTYVLFFKYSFVMKLVKYSWNCDFFLNFTIQSKYCLRTGAAHRAEMKMKKHAFLPPHAMSRSVTKGALPC